MDKITMQDLTNAYIRHKKIIYEMDKATTALDETVVSWELRGDDANIIVKGKHVANLRVDRKHLKLFIEQIKALEIAKIEELNLQYKAQE